MKITFLGAAHEVTGSSTLIEACGKHILVDCGMEQGADIYENCPLPVIPGDIDAVCLTHAHIDHSGKLPALVVAGYSSPIYATEATRRLCDIMLKDSAHIQEFEAEWRNRRAARSGEGGYSPLYTVEDAQKTIKLFKTFKYKESVEIFDGIMIRFEDAGHLLGSASIYIDITENGKTTTLLFSGDIGNIERPLIRDPEKPSRADYVVIESTYGDRIHGKRPDYVKELSDILNETFIRGGNVVIPSFAVGRTQELLYLLRIIKEKKLIKDYPDFPVYVDSPLAVEATNIYADGMTDFYDDETLSLLKEGKDPIHFNGLKLLVTSDESKMINFDKTPKVILSASGMCEAGRIRHHLKHNLWKKESTICFVGYQAVGTLGRKLIEGAECVKLFGETVEVNAKIESLKGISGHADRNGLLDWLSGFENTPQHVFVVHGEDQVTDTFAEAITEKFGWPAMAPYSGGCVDLATGEILSVGIKEPKKAVEKPAQIRKQNAFYRVVAAAKRLLDVVYKNEGLANKELMKFENQINNLADKWDR